MSLFSLLVIYLAMPTQTRAQTRISSTIIGSGGGRAEGNNNRTVVTAGQPIIGQGSSANFGFRAGFWYQSIDFITNLDQIQSELLPIEFRLEQNYPNPFNPNTTIVFSIPNNEFVTLQIYNILGEEVSTLVSERLTAGKYDYNWNASRLASGVYLYRIHAGDYVRVKRMMLLR